MSKRILVGDTCLIPPDWVVKEYGSSRKWRADVRRRMKALEAAVRDAGMGSAFYPKPAPGIVTQLRTFAVQLRKIVSVKNWESGGSSTPQGAT